MVLSWGLHCDEAILRDESVNEVDFDQMVDFGYYLKGRPSTSSQKPTVYGRKGGPA
jgi:hypothetical protein